MTALTTKLLRDLVRLKGQAAAIALVLASGVAVFVMALATIDSLRGAMDAYYERYRFADVFARLTRAPDHLAGRIAGLPGVRLVQTRLVYDVNLDVRGLDEPAIGRLISVRGDGSEGLHRLHLRAGRLLDPLRRSEAIASEAFAAAHALRPGDTLRAIINGRLQTLHIVGIALSPEFVYQIREGDALPDDLRFGVLWMHEDDLAAAFDMRGAFNSVLVDLAPGASAPEVMRRLDALLEPYGGLVSHGRDEQVSHRFLSGELDQLRAMALITPTIFLVVSAFLLNVVASRLIGTQREQIAVLRAFGYTGREIALHYLSLIMLIVAVGVALGTLVGARLGHHLTELYTDFFRFPVFHFALGARVVLLALAAGAAAGLLGTLAAVRRAARLPPAEAMRPEPPARYRPLLIDRAGLRGALSQTARMIVRHLERRPLRALVSVFGVSMAIAMLVLGTFAADSIEYVIEFEFFRAQRHDAAVAFVEPRTERAVRELAHLPGVLYAEPFRAVAARFRSTHLAERGAITGLPADARLRRVVDQARGVVPVPPSGLLLSRGLADLLRVRAGDAVRVEVLEGRRPAADLRVHAVIGDFAGASAWMEIGALRRLMREGDAVSGALLLAGRDAPPDLYARLKSTPAVASVAVKQATLRSFRKTIAENLLVMRLFQVIFAAIIAFGVVYNSARISVAERARELATLRVIGFTRAEISLIQLGELAIITLVAIPLGLLAGYGLSALATAALQTEHQRFPLVIEPHTYALAVTVTLASALVAGLVVRRELDKLDLIEVLKTRA